MHERATSISQQAARREAGRGAWYMIAKRQELVILLVLLGVSLTLSLLTETFLTSTNLFNVTRACSWIAVAAFGESMVIIIGGLDLSVGAVMALSGLVSAMCLRAGWPLAPALVAGLLTGVGTGLANGAMVGRIGLPPFIVTLGTLNFARGLTFVLAQGSPVVDLPASFRALGQYDLALGPLALPLPVLLMVLLAVLVSLLLERTVLGRYIYTVGSNERALQASGVSTTNIKVLVYTMSGLLAALGGVLMTARLGVAAPTAAVGYELDIIAVAVIGGTSLFGGEGSILGVVLGAVMIQVLRNGLVLLGFPGYWETLAIGTIILLVIMLDYWRKRRAAV